MIQTLENRVKMAMRGTRPGATLTAEDVDALYGFIEAEIIDAMKEAKKEGTNAEREACRQIAENQVIAHAQGRPPAEIKDREVLHIMLVVRRIADEISARSDS